METPANTAALQEAAAPLHPNYRPDIDGLRAVAVMVVLGYHAFPRWVPSGFVGVDIFFVISGFLISTIIIGNLEQARFSYVDFYSRRIRRIFPALSAMLAAVLVAGWVSLFPSEFKALGKHVAGGAAFVSNFLLWDESGYFDTYAASKPLLHLWSLGIEEQYYIFWPVILSIAWRKKANLPVVIIAIGTASFIFSLFELRTDPVAAFYSPFTRIWELMIGSALAYVSTAKGWRQLALGSTLPMFLSSAGAIFLLTGFGTISEAREFPGWWAVLPTSGAVLVIASGSRSWVNRWFLSHRLMVSIGKISFPLYLWHWPLLSFAQIVYAGSPPAVVKVILLLAAFVLASLTYLLIERPIRYSAPVSRATLSLVAIAAVIASVGILIYVENGLNSRNVVSYNSALLQEIKFASNPPSKCPGFGDDVISRNKLCTMYQAERSTKTIVLWGDSSTQAWLPVFLDVGKELGYTIINVSHPSCPPLLAARKTKFDYRESREYCQNGGMQLLVLQWMQKIRPDLIVVIANWNSYNERVHKEFITDRPNEAADAASTKRALEARVPETLTKLAQIGRTVVFRSWPTMPTPHAKVLARALALPWVGPISTNANGAAAPLTEFVEDSRQINSIFDNLHRPGLSFFDPSLKICASGACESHIQGVNYYSDDYHVSKAGAMAFHTDIEALLGR